jgi:ClpP class serine protease
MASSKARANAVARGSGRPANNVLGGIATLHWAMQPDLLRTMIAVALRSNPPLQAIESDRGQWLENTYDVTIRDGIATIPVHGPMCRYMDFFTLVSGGTTYEQIARDYLACLKDPAVDGILFDFDTGGGEVHGCQGLAHLLFANRNVKPQAAFGAGDLCSAGHWLAAAVGPITLAPTAIAGCLGVYTCVTDFSKWEKSQGIETIEFRSSQTPRKNLDPATPDGRDELQQVLDALCDVLVNDEARFRNVSVDTVLEDFGQGSVFVGAAAVNAGLADDVGVYDDVHAELRDRAAGSGVTTVIIGAGRVPSSTSATSSTSASETSDMKTPKPSAGTGGAQPPKPVAENGAAADDGTDPNAPADDKKKKDDGEEDDAPEAGAPARQPPSRSSRRASKVPPPNALVCSASWHCSATRASRKRCSPA